MYIYIYIVSAGYEGSERVGFWEWGFRVWSYDNRGGNRKDSRRVSLRTLIYKIVATKGSDGSLLGVYEGLAFRV